MKVDRLVSIIMVLLNRKRIGAQELSDRFEVSTRTIYRDIEAINMAGIPIRSISGVGGGFEIMSQYKIDKNVFSTSDLSAIVMGLSNLSTMLRGDELTNALAKVKSLIPTERAKEIEVIASQIYVDLSLWMGNKNIQPYIEIIKTALQESKLLTFEYIAHYGKQTTRTIEPYQLVMKNTHWYVLGYCYKRNDYRLFRLGRILNLKVEDETFAPRDYDKAQLDFNDVIETMQIDIKIRIHKSIMDRVLDYCTYDNFTPDGEEYYIVILPFLENDYSYDMLLSLGSKCECLEPLHIREELIHRIQAIANIYGN